VANGEGPYSIALLPSNIHGNVYLVTLNKSSAIISPSSFVIFLAAGASLPKPYYEGQMSFPRLRKTLQFVLIAVTAVALSVFLNERLTESPNAKDGHQNLSAAYHLAHHGVVSLSEKLKPSNYREPLPILTLALYIRTHPKLSALTLDEINKGPAVLAVKQHNLVWAFLCMLGVGLLVSSAIKDRLVGTTVAIIAVWLTYFLFLQRNEIINRTYTEIEAAALLVWFSFCLVRALDTARPVWFVAAGVMLGGLSLTKATFLYAGVGLILVLLVLYGLWRPLWPRGRALTLIVLMAVSMAAVVLPWMVRNLIQFGSFEITQRGGTILMLRANYDQMNNDEYLGALYHFTRARFLKKPIGDYLGFSETDLEAGGRLQRLNRSGSASFAASDREAERAGRPEDAVSFYRAARAEQRRLTKHFAKLGVDNPSHEADREMKRQALRLFLEKPIQHVKASVLFMWRGIPKVGNGLTTMLAFIAVWTMALVGLLRRDAVMVGIALLPVGGFIFLSLTSHFSPRLSAPMIPNLIIALTVAAAWILIWLIPMPRSARPLRFSQFLSRAPTEA